MSDKFMWDKGDKIVLTPPSKELKKIKEIYFQIADAWNHGYACRLQINGNVARRHNDESSIKMYYINEYFSPEETEIILKSIEDLHIECWERKYMPNGIVLDGETWELTIHYDDGHSKKSSGENAYPDNWNEFLMIMSNIFEIECDED